MLLHTTPSHPSPPDGSSAPELTRRQRLQLAVRDYGSTVMVFHITISLASLGAFYTAVSRSAECWPRNFPKTISTSTCVSI